MTRCPCGLPADYPDCCGRFHAGEGAPTAELLMRSRYSAFALGDEAYLLATWHHATGVLEERSRFVREGGRRAYVGAAGDEDRSWR